MIFPSYEDHRPELNPDDERLPEIHLYFGSFCNRSCGFCVVFGSPQGWVAGIRGPILDHLLHLLHPRGQLKIYGGEPTLVADDIHRAIHYLRQGDFAGRIVIFSNGIQAARLIELLDADSDTCAVLNYSILTGTGADPIPPSALRALSDYERRCPGRIFAGHSDLVKVGRAVNGDRELLSERRNFEYSCPHCHPVVTTRNQYHACPFAVENDSPHYRLGNLDTPVEEVLRNFRSFLHWIDTVLEPAARNRGIHPCTVCTAADLPMPDYVELVSGGQRPESSPRLLHPEFLIKSGN